MTAYRSVLPAALVAVSLTCLLTSLAVTLHAEPAGYGELAASQASQNAQAGARRSPAHVSPVPTEEVSAQEQALIAAPYPPHFNADPKTPEEWKTLINARAAVTAKVVPGLKERFQLSVESKVIAGVKTYVVTPTTKDDSRLEIGIMYDGNSVVLHRPGSLQWTPLGFPFGRRRA